MENTSPKGMYAELGATGVEQTHGYLHDEFLPQLRGAKLITQMREMSDNDSVVGAVLFAIEMMIRKSTMTFEPADGDEDTAYADFLNECWWDMTTSPPDVLSSIMTMLPYGWSFLEVVLKKREGGGTNDPAHTRSKYDDGRIGWRKWVLRPQDTLLRWDLDDTGGVNAMVQLAAPTWRESSIPIERGALFRTTTARSNPEGRSVLRNAWPDWYFKQRIQTIEGIGIERDLAGLPVGRLPAHMLMASASEDDKAAVAAFKKVLVSIRRDESEGLLWPVDYDVNGNKLFDIELLSAGGSRQFDTDAIVARYDQRIAMTVLADFILLGHEAVGTQALSVSKIDLFTSALAAWLESIAGVINRHLVPRLMRANGMDERRSPRMVFGNVTQMSIRELAELISTLADSGMPLFPDTDLEQWVRERAEMPAADPDKLAERDELLRLREEAMEAEPSEPSVDEDEDEAEGPEGEDPA